MPDIDTRSLSQGWLEALALTAGAPGNELMNLVVTIRADENGEVDEEANVRAAVDAALADQDMASIRTVAGTIFPVTMWNPARPRAELRTRYLRAFPRIRRNRKNRRGTYFQRLISYPSADPPGFDQLNQVIQTYVNGNHRRSALQGSLIVPEADLNDARQQGFPCMQQIAFIPDGEAGTLHIVGFYPLQYLFERAYGNYLGLINLGKFMAHEMQLRFAAMSCVSVVAALEVPEARVAHLLQLREEHEELEHEQA